MTEQLPQLLAPCRLWAKCLFGCALAIIIGSMGFVSANAFAKAPLEVDCRADDGRCPELIIAGDPPAEVPGYGLAPIRGYGDPSLRQDRQTGALWLSYSWVSTLVAPGSKPGKPIIDIGVGIHFARSGDGGRSFQFIRKIWTSDPEINEGTDGYSEHEVSTISRAGAGWAVLDLRYFNPRGNGNDFKADSFHFEFVEDADLARLSTGATQRLGGPLTAPIWRPFIDLSAVSGLGMACPVWTEPSLFEDRGVLYLLTQCKTPRNPADGFLGIFARRAGHWTWVDRLTIASDATALGGNELTQADIARARDGSILLIVTPNIVAGSREHHLGCAVLSLASLDPPVLRRDDAKAPIVRARITSSDSVQNGPGACAYDPDSATGVLIVRRALGPARGVVFSIHSTGLHP